MKFFKLVNNVWEVEVLRVGTWNGNKFVTEDLQEIVDNFNRFKSEIQVPLKFGHDMDQNLIGQSDGDPAIGWVESLRIEGGILIATFGNVPDIVVDLIEAKLYKNVSVELVSNVKVGDERVGEVLIGVALLGADQPAVSGLQDLQTFLTSDTLESLHLTSKEVVKEFEYNHKPVKKATKRKELSMTEEEIKQMKADLKKQEEETKLLTEKNSALVKQNEEASENIRLETFKGTKSTFINKLDELVKASTIAPAVREEFEKVIDSQVKTFTSTLGLSFDAELVLKILSIEKPKQTKKETATENPGDVDTSINTPDVIAMRKAREFVLDKKAKDMHEGLTLAFQQDPELEKQYILFRESPATYQELNGKGA